MYTRCQSVSQSFYHTLLPTEHMVHTHTLVFFSSGVESRHLFVFSMAGIARVQEIRTIFLLPFAFTYLSCWRRS